MARQWTGERKARQEHEQEGQQNQEVGALDRYLDELSGISLLTPQQEIELAQAIVTHELAYWRALLSYAPARPLILEQLEQAALPERELAKLHHLLGKTTGQGKARAQSMERASQVLYELDVTRALLPQVGGAVHASFRERPSARAYSARVDAARRAHDAAKNRLATANLRLVVAMARRYDQKLMSLADLVQEGNLGLMRAVERFDPRRGFRFSTYATWWIRHAFNRGLSDRGRLIRIPVHAYDDAQRLARAATVQAARTGQPPELEHLAEETGLSKEKLAFLRQHVNSGRPVSLDRPLRTDADSTLLDVLAEPEPCTPEERMDAQAWQARLATSLHVLTPLELDIVHCRFGLDDREELTLREIGSKYNLSRERIRQLQEQALRKLRVEIERTKVESVAA